MRIVISADSSVEGDVARNWCAANVRPGDEVIAVIGSDQLSEVMLSVSPLMGVADPALLRESVERRLESAVAARGVSCDTKVSYHSQARAVMETARAEHADLIVVGKRAHNAVTDAITNETALHLVHHPPCPVLVVPAITN
jgi:nucleotide-binding universal stress UspA family protein